MKGGGRELILLQTIHNEYIKLDFLALNYFIIINVLIITQLNQNEP
jgi:hypothetical protein